MKNCMLLVPENSLNCQFCKLVQFIAIDGACLCCSLVLLVVYWLIFLFLVLLFESHKKYYSSIDISSGNKCLQETILKTPKQNLGNLLSLVIILYNTLINKQFIVLLVIVCDLEMENYATLRVLIAVNVINWTHFEVPKTISPLNYLQKLKYLSVGLILNRYCYCSNRNEYFKRLNILL